MSASDLPPMFSLRPLRLAEDLATIHAWVSQPYARYWGMVGHAPDQVATAYREIARHADVFLGLQAGEPAFLVERYWPGDDPIGAHYAVEPGDRGMHVLVAPPDQPVAGFTWAVFAAVMDFLFSDPAVDRVVVEPDIRNAKIHALNRRAGFRYQRIVELPHKTAHLATCTRAEYAAARARAAGHASAAAPAVTDPLGHLRPEVWTAVTAALTRKVIAELAHERVLEPRLVAPVAGDGAWATYVLAADTPGTAYHFRARRLALEHWDLDRGSLAKVVGDEQVALDAVELILDLNGRLGIAAGMLPVYLEEITSTLHAAAFKHTHQALTADDLVHAEFQEVERAMTEGHPAFVANSGRVGFDAADYRAYAPEAAAPVHLIWLAAHVRHTELTCAADLTYARLIDEELGAETVAAHDATLRQQGLDPAAYRLLPVHPWQWHDRLAMTFAPDLAARDLVCLGYGRDTYQAQQSIRTFFNVDRPERRYVKTALSVLNMGFMRGLSADYMRNTPPINDWIDDLLRGDPFFAQKGFSILREVAGIGYRNPIFEAAAPKGSPYRKMLAALWRESPMPKLAPGQRLMTMAALLHRDRDGAALLPRLIRASGLTIDAWLERYLDGYLAPLVHCLVRHELAFMPHGENVILVLEDHVPVRVLLKDIAEEAAVMDPTRDLPEAVQRLRVAVPMHLRALSIFTDVFDGILRHLAQILVADAGYAEARFWQRVGACLQTYQGAHPELAERFAGHDLFAPEFLHSCLNRLQLRNNRQMLDLTDPTAGLCFAGSLANPVAQVRDGGLR